MAQHRRSRPAKSLCPLSADNFYTPPNLASLIRALEVGSRPALRFRRTCAITFSSLPNWKGRISNQPTHISKDALRAVAFKLTLRLQAPYTFSS